jgi:hypothetical protein
MRVTFNNMESNRRHLPIKSPGSGQHKCPLEFVYFLQQRTPRVESHGLMRSGGGAKTAWREVPRASYVETGTLSSRRLCSQPLVSVLGRSGFKCQQHITLSISESNDGLFSKELSHKLDLHIRIMPVMATVALQALGRLSVEQLGVVGDEQLVE